MINLGSDNFFPRKKKEDEEEETDITFFVDLVHHKLNRRLLPVTNHDITLS